MCPLIAMLVLDGRGPSLRKCIVVLIADARTPMLL